MAWADELNIAQHCEARPGAIIGAQWISAGLGFTLDRMTNTLRHRDANPSLDTTRSRFSKRSRKTTFCAFSTAISAVVP